jgi:hypothetical protein
MIKLERKEETISIPKAKSFVREGNRSIDKDESLNSTKPRTEKILAPPLGLEEFTDFTELKN